MPIFYERDRRSDIPDQKPGADSKRYLDPRVARNASFQEEVECGLGKPDARYGDQLRKHVKYYSDVSIPPELNTRQLHSGSAIIHFSPLELLKLAEALNQIPAEEKERLGIPSDPETTIERREAALKISNTIFHDDEPIDHGELANKLILLQAADDYFRDQVLKRCTNEEKEILCALLGISTPHDMGTVISYID